MQLFINGSHTSVLNVADNETVFSVKERLANSDGIPCEEQMLSFAGRPLEDEDTLSSYGITDLSTLSVDVRMLGGKWYMSVIVASSIIYRYLMDVLFFFWNYYSIFL